MSLSVSKRSAPRFIISGAPASGKGTQCEYIRDEYKVVHLSTGDILRSAVQSGSQIGLKAKEYMDNGQLVPDELMIDLVLIRLNEVDCVENGWLLDGFPRTRAQADALVDAGFLCDAFIQLDVDESVLVERVVGRRMDPETGKIYHLTFNPPPRDPAVIDRLVHRSDDTEEKVKLRIQAYNNNLSSIVEKYSDCLIRVNGNGAPDNIWRELRSRIPRSFKYEVIFILGGPGSGKGTLCERLSGACGYTHLSAGDLLREEVKSGSQYADMINSINVQGGLVPADLVVSLLSKAMLKAFVNNRSKKFMIDGFPRNIDNLNTWYSLMASQCVLDFVLYIDCPMSIMKERIMNRAKTSGRSDDNEETLVKRFRTFEEETMPVLKSYDRLGKLRTVDGTLDPDFVFRQAKKVVDSIQLIPPMQRTFAFIKPDAVANGSIPEILDRISEGKLSVIQSQMVHMSKEVASKFYGEHAGKGFYDELVDFMSSGPALAMILEGTDCIRVWRDLLGPTNTFVAQRTAPRTIRSMFGTNETKNACHGSDSESSALREIDFFWSVYTGPGFQSGVGSQYDDKTIFGLSLGGLALQETYAMIKPITADLHYDAIMSIVAGFGFEVVSEVKTQLTKPLADKFYGEHKGKGFFDELTGYMSSRKMVGLRLRRPGAIVAWRHLIGPTNFEKARAQRPNDCIRAKYAIDGTMNAVHGSDSPLSASREINFFFSFGSPSLPTGWSTEAPNSPRSSSLNNDPSRKIYRVPAVSKEEVVSMQEFSTKQVDPIMIPIFRKLLIQRPADIAAFVINELQSTSQ